MVIKCYCIEMNQVGKQHLVSKTMRLLSKKTIIYLERVSAYLLKLLVMKKSSKWHPFVQAFEKWKAKERVRINVQKVTKQPTKSASSRPEWEYETTC